MALTLRIAQRYPRLHRCPCSLIAVPGLNLALYRPLLGRKDRTARLDNVTGPDQMRRGRPDQPDGRRPLRPGHGVRPGQPVRPGQADQAWGVIQTRRTTYTLTDFFSKIIRPVGDLTCITNFSTRKSAESLHISVGTRRTT